MSYLKKLSKPGSIVLLAIFCLSILPAIGQPATGPLRICQDNKRYFTDDSGKAIFLTGSHTWANFATDQGTDYPPAEFDYDRYLDFLVKHNHNFFRGWIWDLALSYEGPNGGPFYWDPFPWKRTGPGLATDGKPKFDLEKYNPEFLERIRARARKAGEKGIYVSIMLFQGFAVQFDRDDNDGYPLDGRNNINGIDAGSGYASNTLQYPLVTAKQEEYVRKVIDAVNDLDNILYEISNESGSYSNEWQYHMIDFIHRYEAGKSKQHPVGMTFAYKGGSNSDLFKSPADWISPDGSSGYGYPLTDPPAADGSKVIINDTDHSYYWTGLKKNGVAAQQAWVWKNFLRGNNILFMDPYLSKIDKRNDPSGNTIDKYFGVYPDPYWDTIRMAMGRVRSLAMKIDLTTTIPQNSLSSTSYCLANPGKEYLVYNPDTVNLSFTVDIPKGNYTYKWYNPSVGEVEKQGEIDINGERYSFTAPFKGDAVLYIRKK